MIGASKADMMTSNTAEMTRRMMPPLPRRVDDWKRASTSPKTFGIKRMTMVVPKSSSDLSASNRGQAGNKVKPSEKYSGRM
jgi:hypothetical protein